MCCAGGNYSRGSLFCGKCPSSLKCAKILLCERFLRDGPEHFTNRRLPHFAPKRQHNLFLGRLACRRHFL
jgi:hypothetical protein